MLRILPLLAIAALATPADAQTVIGSIRAGEAAVRQMPIQERPNRLGHFYGNTVRRRHHGTLFVNRMHGERPLARYLYLPR